MHETTTWQETSYRLPYVGNNACRPTYRVILSSLCTYRKAKQLEEEASGALYIQIMQPGE